MRGVVALPSGTGRDVRVAVIAKDAKADEAKAAGAEIVGAEDLVERIQGGFMEFDRVIATPDMMALVGRLGKVLGPRGLMPNPRVGTVTPNVGQAVKDAKGGSIEFRVEKAGIVHAGIGKASFTEDALAANVRALVDALNRAKPSGAKGTYVKRISLSLDHGPRLQGRAGQHRRARRSPRFRTARKAGSVGPPSGRSPLSGEPTLAMNSAGFSGSQSSRNSSSATKPIAW